MTPSALAAVTAWRACPALPCWRNVPALLLSSCQPINLCAQSCTQKSAPHATLPCSRWHATNACFLSVQGSFHNAAAAHRAGVPVSQAYISLEPTASPGGHSEACSQAQPDAKRWALGIATGAHCIDTHHAAAWAVAVRPVTKLTLQQQQQTTVVGCECHFELLCGCAPSVLTLAQCSRFQSVRRGQPLWSLRW